jgi:hypothetical protein
VKYWIGIAMSALAGLSAYLAVTKHSPSAAACMGVDIFVAVLCLLEAAREGK